MPIKHAAEKALRKAKKSVAVNRAVKDAIKKILKTGRRSLTAKKFDEAKALMPKLAKMVDKAAKRHIIAPHRASRIKSRFAKSIKQTIEKEQK